jgi:hypothetical protein
LLPSDPIILHVTEYAKDGATAAFYSVGTVIAVGGAFIAFRRFLIELPFGTAFSLAGAGCQVRYTSDPVSPFAYTARLTLTNNSRSALALRHYWTKLCLPGDVDWSASPGDAQSPPPTGDETWSGRRTFSTQRLPHGLSLTLTHFEDRAEGVSMAQLSIRMAYQERRLWLFGVHKGMKYRSGSIVFALDLDEVRDVEERHQRRLSQLPAPVSEPTR